MINEQTLRKKSRKQKSLTIYNQKVMLPSVWVVCRLSSQARISHLPGTRRHFRTIRIHDSHGRRKKKEACINMRLETQFTTVCCQAKNNVCENQFIRLQPITELGTDLLVHNTNTYQPNRLGILNYLHCYLLVVGCIIITLANVNNVSRLKSYEIECHQQL